MLQGILKRLNRFLCLYAILFTCGNSVMVQYRLEYCYDVDLQEPKTAHAVTL
jgi:hypothetical protein